MIAIRSLIIDDEPLARSRVRMMLAGHDDVEVVAECSNGAEALALAAKETPNLLFLDIEMPEVAGFEMLEALASEPRPAILFITAHEEFALAAFEANAVDYLVKPFSQERLDRAMDRVRRFLGNRSTLPAAAETVARKRRRDRFVVRLRDQVVFIKASAIDWISAEGNYARLHTADRKLLMRESLQNLEAELDPAMFLRVHRSAIVNIDRVRKLVAGPDGTYSIVLQSEESIPLGPTYRDRLEAFLGQKL